MRELERLE